MPKNRPVPRDRNLLFRLAREIDPEPSHCFQVRKNAERLYAALAPVHGFGAREWKLLEAAALLHDIGHRRGLQGHHKHSRDMILARRWPGLGRAAGKMVACIARYHRKSLPSPTHKCYRDLSPPDQERVHVLAAILRIADGLDRSHRASVCGIRAEIGRDSITLHVWQRIELPDDLASALRKADLFKQTFQVALHIVSDTSRPGFPV